MMATAQITIDKSQVQPHWNAAVQAIGDLRNLGGAVQDSLGTIKLTGNVGGTPGTVQFSVDAATVITRLQELKARIVTAQGEIDQVIAMFQAGLPVIVNQVN